MRIVGSFNVGEDGKRVRSEYNIKIPKKKKQRGKITCSREYCGQVRREGEIMIQGYLVIVTKLSGHDFFHDQDWRPKIAGGSTVRAGIPNASKVFCQTVLPHQFNSTPPFGNN